ncbi:MAG TPA: type II toxin-antitoxin system RelE/ParE family toxin [Rhizomicrobium sp.]|nr:type II toxin-antitoxin system RelE/ParE family toxin [Rhizomicrobium sp.]
MKLRFTPRAASDLVDIAEFIRRESPRGALRVRASILQSLERLVAFPRMGRRQRTAGVRKFVARRYGYVIYYSIDVVADELIVLSIRHPAQGRLAADR